MARYRFSRELDACPLSACAPTNQDVKRVEAAGLFNVASTSSGIAPLKSGHSKNPTGDWGPANAPNCLKIQAFSSPPKNLGAKAPEFRRFFSETGHCPNSGTAWLG